MGSAIKLTRIVRSAKRVSLRINTLDKPLVVTEEIIHRHRLVDGIILTKSQLDQLCREAQSAVCRQTAQRMLAAREYAEKELHLKLRRKGFAREVVDPVVAELKRLEVINDYRYANNVARLLLERRPCGRAYLIAHLQKRGIERSLAEQVAGTFLDDRDDIELAEAALRQRQREYAQFDVEVARRKAYNYLSRRGFSYAAAKTAFAHLFNDPANGGDD